MFARLRPHLTYANVVSSLCLFIVLGGSAYAATTITGKNVKNSSLTGGDIRNSSLTTKDVRNRSLFAADFKRGQLPTGARGPQGPQGLQGAQGPKGDTGAAGSALGFAFIKGNVAPDPGPQDLVDESRSKNVTDANVFHPQNGVYCFKGLPFTPRNVVATIVATSGSGGPSNHDIPYARTSDGPNVCFEPQQAFVETLRNGHRDESGVLRLLQLAGQ